MTEITSENIKYLYNSLLKQKKYYEGDLQASYDALLDNSIDYMFKKECQNDIIVDRKQLEIIEASLEEVVKFANEHNIALVENVKKIK